VVFTDRALSHFRAIVLPAPPVPGSLGVDGLRRGSSLGSARSPPEGADPIGGKGRGHKMLGEEDIVLFVDDLMLVKNGAACPGQSAPCPGRWPALY
jgi:hypothetical protein